MKLLRTVCVLGIALCLATSVYAGTQSVKISGDLIIRGLARGNYELERHHNEPTTLTGESDTSGIGTPTGTPYPGTSNWQTYFMSTAEVQIDADLTDNVSAVFRLFNQRDWDTSTKTISPTTTNVAFDRGGYGQKSQEFDIGVDLAYVELKEFLYSPLTLRIGRQDIWMGKGLIVGGKLRDPNNNINADEYTCMTSFDAFRATLDYDPWTVDAMFAKIWENEIGSKDDEDLYGVNIGYIFDVYNAEAEAYYYLKESRQLQPRILKQHNTVNTVGMRGSADPIENWTVAAEGAYQFGDFIGMRDQAEIRRRSAWAVDASAECRYFRENFAWKPVLGAEYIYYSGDSLNAGNVTATDSGTYNGWDPMYRAKFDTAYREFVGKYNFTQLGWRGGSVNYVNPYPDASYTNQHQALVYGSVTPTDSLTLDGKLAFFWQDKRTKVLSTRLDSSATAGEYTSLKSFMGTELDLKLTWDYTEDVAFGVLAAWFFPGGFYENQGDKVATDLVGTVKLSF